MIEAQRHLASLRLLGMHESLDYRITHATEAGLSYEDFLIGILEDEVIYRKNKKCERLKKRAKFRDDHHLENFDHTKKRGVAKSVMKQWETLSFLEAHQNLLFIGGTGVGKTFLAEGIGNHCCREGYETLFFSVNLLFEEVRSQKVSGKYLSFLSKIKKTRLIILDDFGLRRYTHEEATILYELLEERYSKGSLVVTSQVRPEGWKDLFEDEVIAEAILDRILSKSHRYDLKGESYRKCQKENLS